MCVFFDSVKTHDWVSKSPPPLGFIHLHSSPTVTKLNFYCNRAASNLILFSPLPPQNKYPEGKLEFTSVTVSRQRVPHAGLNYDVTQYFLNFFISFIFVQNVFNKKFCGKIIFILFYFYFRARKTKRGNCIIYIVMLAQGKKKKLFYFGSNNKHQQTKFYCTRIFYFVVKPN